MMCTWKPTHVPRHSQKLSGWQLTQEMSHAVMLQSPVQWWRHRRTTEWCEMSGLIYEWCEMRGVRWMVWDEWCVMSGVWWVMWDEWWCNGWCEMSGVRWVVWDERCEISGVRWVVWDEWCEMSGFIFEWCEMRGVRWMVWDEWCVMSGNLFAMHACLSKVGRKEEAATRELEDCVPYAGEFYTSRSHFLRVVAPQLKICESPVTNMNQPVWKALFGNSFRGQKVLIIKTPPNRCKPGRIDLEGARLQPASRPTSEVWDDWCETNSVTWSVEATASHAQPRPRGLRACGDSALCTQARQQQLQQETLLILSGSSPHFGNGFDLASLAGNTD